MRAIKIARVWYVSDGFLKEFLINQSYRNELRRQNLSHTRREEHRSAQSLPRILHAISPPARPTLSRPRILAHFEQAFARNAHTFTQTAGGQLSMISQTLEFLHKLAALVTELVLVLGTYALLNPVLRTFALASFPETAAAAAATITPRF